MMNSLFSSFEPFYYNSLCIISLPALIMFFFLMENSKTFLLKQIVYNSLNKEMKNISLNTFMNNFLIFMFMTISLTNLHSLTPFSFTMNTQASVVFSSSMNMFCYILICKFMTPKMFFIHLVPKGSPIFLSPFLVLIELMSLMIRPITLSVRMMANMMTGHLLIHLLSKLFFSIKIIMPITFILSTSLLSVELMVAMIQAYIFCTLLAIYLAE